MRALVVITAMALIGCAPASGRARGPSVVVIGIDGMDPDLLKRFVERGRMPHVAALMASGSFSTLATSTPPQSPVAWSNFITGMDPGGHGIFDFIHRDPATYRPRFSTSTITAPERTLALGPWRIPLGAGEAKLLRKGEAFWQILERHGVPCAVYRIPSNFPPAPGKGRTLSGMGTPDLAGGYGTFSFFTDEPRFADGPVAGGEVHRVTVRDGRVEAALAGPENTLRRDRPVLTCPFVVELDPERQTARIQIAGETIVLGAGEWSGWTRIGFRALGPLRRISGICRFHLLSARPFRLYVSPINLDPTAPALPISTPPAFAGDLCHRIGDFYTQGMPEDTKAFEAGVLDEAGFIEQTDLVLAESTRLLDAALDRYAGGFLFFYLSTIDPSCHMLWRPMADRAGGSAAAERVERLYAVADSLIGVVMGRIPRDATLLVMSDHGFAPYEKKFHLNTWLHQTGYLALERPGQPAGPLLDGVAWRRTRAYALGINGLYLNVLHREGKGVVRRGPEYEALLDSLAAGLLAVRDPETGARVVTRVDRAIEAYHGGEIGNAPDLIVGYNRGYRGSDESALGEIGASWLTPNEARWSGDHCMDPSLVPGVLLVNRPQAAQPASLVDLPATILSLYDVPRPAAMRGRALWDP